MVADKLQCTYCSHPPYSYRKRFVDHTVREHPEVTCDKAFALAVVEGRDRRMALAKLSSAEFQSDVTDIQLPALKATKKKANATDHKKNHPTRKTLNAQWNGWIGGR